MRSLKVFLQEFIQNSGFWVFLSFFITKICAFLPTLLLVRILSEREFGLLSIVPAVFTSFATFTGFGLPVGLLRYGSAIRNEAEKRTFSNQIFREGFYLQILLTVLFMLSSIFFVQKYEGIVFIFSAFAVRLFGFYFQTHLQTDYRIHFENKKFALVNIWMSVLNLALVVILSYFFGLGGYLAAMAISPYFIFFWFKKLHLNFKRSISPFSKKEILNFSINASFTNLASEALFSVDILILSFLLAEKEVGDYRVAILIPSNLVFLSQSFLQTDYAKIALHSGSRRFLNNYLKRYYQLFVPVAIVLFLVLIIFRSYIIKTLFGTNYLHITKIYTILLAGFLLSMLLRVLYGNMLSAIGKIAWNTWGTTLSVMVLVVGAYFLVPEFGTLGMVYAMVVALTFCGLFLLVAFFHEVRKLGNP